MVVEPPGLTPPLAAIALEVTRGVNANAAVATIMTAAIIIVFVVIKDHCKDVLLRNCQKISLSSYSEREI